MFSEQFHVQIEMFSFVHLLVLAVCIAIIALLYVFRKKFIENKVLDKVFRYTVATTLILFEIGLYAFRIAAKEQWSIEYLPLELCGMTMWLTAFVLYFNKASWIKTIFFWAMAGGLLSLFVVGMDYSYPHFRAFQYFGTHFLFILGNLYFLFTGKVKIVYKDLLKSSVILFLIAIPIFIINITCGYNFMYVMKPPSEVAFLGEMLGLWWTPVFCLVVFAIFNLMYLFIWGLPKLKNKMFNKK